MFHKTKTRNQHHVPQFALKEFCCNGRIKAYNIQSGKTIIANPRNIMSSRDYYNFELEEFIPDRVRSGTIEDLIAKIEGEVCYTFQELIESGAGDSTAALLSLQLVRSPHLRMVNQNIHNMWKRSTFKSSSSRVAKHMEYQYGELRNNMERKHVLTFFEDMDRMQELIWKTPCYLVTTSESREFVLSDSPVVINLSPYGYASFMMDEINSAFLPLTPEKGIIFTKNIDEIAEERILNGDSRIELNDLTTDILNQTQIIQANSFFAYMDKSKLINSMSPEVIKSPTEINCEAVIHMLTIKESSSLSNILSSLENE